MILGIVDHDGTPVIELEVAGQIRRAVIDTGFNGDLELPRSLQHEPSLRARFVGRATSLLAGGQSIEEDVYLVDFAFHETTVRAQATFVEGAEMLIGTHLLRLYRLEVDFPARSVAIDLVG